MCLLRRQKHGSRSNVLSRDEIYDGEGVKSRRPLLAHTMLQRQRTLTQAPASESLKRFFTKKK